MNKRIILQPGDTIGDLTIIKFDHKDHRSRRFFLCRCICGQEKVIQGSLITSGNTKSCGCRIRKAARLRVKPNSEAAFNLVYNSYRCHARNRNLEFLLSKVDFRTISQQKCNYCGADLSNISKSPHNSGDFIHNGIDRIDSTKGYIVGNVVACCKLCNIAKMNHSITDFLQWIKRVYDHNAMAEQWTLK